MTINPMHRSVELTDDEGLIAWAANSMSEPLVLAAPGVVLIKADAAQAILDRANELSGIDNLDELP